MDADAEGTGAPSKAEIPPDAPHPTDPDHPAAETLSLLGRAHAIGVLYLLVNGGRETWRFNRLQEELDVSPNTLSSRLSELREAGLIERRSYDEIPPRVEYEATEKGRELSPVFKELGKWFAEHGGE